MRLKKPQLLLAAWLISSLLIGITHLRAETSQRGLWLIHLEGIGDLTLDLNKYKQTGRSIWLFDDRGFSWKEENGQISLYRGNPQKTEAPELLFQLKVENDGSLTFQQGGLIDARRLSWWKLHPWLVFDENDPVARQRFYYAREQRERFTERGTLLPLPKQFPSDFVDTTALVFCDDEHTTYSLLQYESLTSGVVQTIGDSTLAKINQSGWTFVTPRIASHPNCPPTLLAKLFALPDDPIVWRAAALNPAAPKDYQATYLERIQKGSERVRSTVARDPDAPRKAWELALAPGEPYALENFARNPSAPPEMLAEVAKRQTGSAADKLAGNPQTPPVVLDMLIGVIDPMTKRPDKQVLWAILRNTAASSAQIEKALRLLCTSPSQNERSSAAGDPRLPIDLFPKIAADRSIQVRLQGAMNPSATEDILQLLSSDLYREVASRARENLQQRFPETWHKLNPTLLALDTLNPASGPTEELIAAIQKGDVETVRRCLAENNDPDEPVRIDLFVSWALQKHFTELKSLLAVEVRKKGDEGIGALTDSQFLTVDHIPWMKQEGFLNPSSANRILYYAVEHQNEALAKAMLDAGASQQSANQSDVSPLIQACLKRNLPMVRLLLSRGADPSQKFQGKTAADVAAQTMFIPGLRLLDKDGKHQKVLDDFAHDFPSTKQSKCLGQWTNRRDGFNVFKLNLEADATGVGVFATNALPFTWKENKPGELVFFVAQAVVTSPAPSFSAHFDPKQQTLTLIAPGQPQQILYRDAENH